MSNNYSYEDHRKPCGGTNSNICVAEGCYGEACLKVPQRKRDANRFYSNIVFQEESPSGFDFPVANEKPVEKPVTNKERFSGRFSGKETIFRSFLLHMVFLGLVSGLMGLVIFTLPVMVLGWWGLLTMWPLVSILLVLGKR